MVGGLSSVSRGKPVGDQLPPTSGQIRGDYERVIRGGYENGLARGGVMRLNHRPADHPAPGKPPPTTYRPAAGMKLATRTRARALAGCMYAVTGAGLVVKNILQKGLPILANASIM